MRRWSQTSARDAQLSVWTHGLLGSVFVHNASFRVGTGKSRSVRGETCHCNPTQTSVIVQMTNRQSVLVGIEPLLGLMTKFKSMNLTLPSSDLCDDSAGLSFVSSRHLCWVCLYMLCLRSHTCFKTFRWFTILYTVCTLYTSSLSVQTFYGSYSLPSFMYFAACIVIKLYKIN